MNSILSRYIFREVAVPYGLVLMVLVSLLLLQRIIQITDWVVNRGISLGHMLLMVGLLLPFFMVMIIPMSLLLATLLAVNRLSADNEITAMKAGGVGIWSLFPPVLALGVINMLLTGFLSLYIVPRATDYSQQLLFDIARSNARAALRAKNFREITPGLTVYVDTIKGEILEGLFISEIGVEKRLAPKEIDELYIFAKEGRLVSDPEKRINYLMLKDGSIHITDNFGKLYRKIEFGRYDLKIEIEKNNKGKIEKGSRFDVMGMADLAAKREEYKRKYNEALDAGGPESMLKARAYRTALTHIGIAWHQKFSLPVACLILALWGIPLGIQPPRAARYQGIVVSIVLCLSYYLMVSGGRIMATRFELNPALTAWLPNALVLVTGIFFVYRVSRDKPFPLAGYASGVIYRWGEWVSRVSAKFRRKEPS